MTPIPAIHGLSVRSLLGRGGMGAVWDARDEHGTRVAVKVIAQSPRYDNSVARARFAGEIEALSRIADAHVLRLRYAGSTDGAPYAVLDAIDGFGLDEIRGGVPWRVAVHLGRQLARAIAAVHRAGYVHRDIKPSNIMVTSRAHLTLIDFGLARRADVVTGDDTAVASLTQPGLCMGTPRFLAPEVAKGQPATQRSDLHAFGLVMAHLIGASFDDEPPEELLELVTACMEPNPDLRPESAEAILAVLERLPARVATLQRSVVEDTAIAPPQTTADTGPARPFPLARR